MVQQQTEPPVSEGASQPPVSEEERKRIQDAYEYGADLMRERKTYKQIVRALEIRGLDTATAEALAQNLTGLRDTRSKTERGPAYQKMLIGVLMVCAGVVIIQITWDSNISSFMRFGTAVAGVGVFILGFVELW